MVLDFNNQHLPSDRLIRVRIDGRRRDSGRVGGGGGVPSPTGAKKGREGHRPQEVKQAGLGLPIAMSETKAWSEINTPLGLLYRQRRGGWVGGCLKPEISTLYIVSSKTAVSDIKQHPRRCTEQVDGLFTREDSVQDTRQRGCDGSSTRQNKKTRTVDRKRAFLAACPFPPSPSTPYCSSLACPEHQQALPKKVTIVKYACTAVE